MKAGNSSWEACSQRCRARAWGLLSSQKRSHSSAWPVLAGWAEKKIAILLDMRGNAARRLRADVCLWLFLCSSVRQTAGNRLCRPVMRWHAPVAVMSRKAIKKMPVVC